MGETCTRCWTLDWEIAEVPLPFEEIKDTKRETGKKILRE